MLPSSNRLRKSQKIENIFNQGKSVYCDPVLIKFMSVPRRETKIAFAVGTKAFPKAVDRNRRKRHLRRLMRDFLPHIKQGFDIVVVLNAEKQREASPQKIEQALGETLKKAHLLNK